MFPTESKRQGEVKGKPWVADLQTNIWSWTQSQIKQWKDLKKTISSFAWYWDCNLDALEIYDKCPTRSLVCLMKYCTQPWCPKTFVDHQKY